MFTFTTQDGNEVDAGFACPVWASGRLTDEPLIQGLIPARFLLFRHGLRCWETTRKDQASCRAERKDNDLQCRCTLEGLPGPRHVFQVVCEGRW